MIDILYTHQKEVRHESLSCTCYGSCRENSSNCAMDRLLPYDEYDRIPLHQDVLGFHDPPIINNSTPFHTGNRNMGREDNNSITHFNSRLQPYSRVIHSPCLQFDGLKYETTTAGVHFDPHSPICMVPLPEDIGEPSFIRKRNERERERVRCVNDGYDRLKEHLPLPNKDRRLSKVETLRGAIKYIRQLKRLLDLSEEELEDRGDCSLENRRDKLFLSSQKRRFSSLSLSLSSSSEQDSSLSDS